MEVIIDDRSGQQVPSTRIAELADFVIRNVGHLEGISEAQLALLELSISFVDVAEITQLNTDFRGIAKPTDVLSFEMDLADSMMHVDDVRCDQTIMLGDIVINPDVAREHAVIEELDLEEEIWVLVIHGILHLLGYDHEGAEDAEAMEELEDRLLSKWSNKLAQEMI